MLSVMSDKVFYSSKEKIFNDFFVNVKKRDMKKGI